MEQVQVVVAGSSGAGDPVPSPPSPTSPPAPPTPPVVDRWTAPTTPTTTLPSAPVMVDAPEPIDPAGVLDELADRIEGVSGAILASVDGFGLSRSTSMADEPAHAAMLAAAVGLAHQLASMGGGDRLRQLVVDHDAGLLLVWPIGPQRVLAVLATSTVDQRALRTAVHAHVPTLSGTTA